MGDHSKPKGAFLGAALKWAKAHPKVVSAVVVGVVGVITAVKPEFPGAAVLSVVHGVLGA
ncbi:gp51 [Streptomyces phage phiBT1]|uniref:Gp51 n=1 Tax=Lomovskayavirus BT1 TaxID=225588 RepID=Q859A7_9CAUD|nr:gp51 [Streptomyces phage phiBT1]CAD80118.1 gp51 [Lomovskayavirus BT1]